MSDTLRGSGPVSCTDDRCHGHRAQCLFGRPHTWATWYDNGQLMRTEDTYHCCGCGGVCVGDEPADARTDPFLTGRVFEAASRYAGAHAGACNLITSAGAAATQTVWHLHVHYVPRREGDGLPLPWTGQVREVTNGG